MNYCVLLYTVFNSNTVKNKIIMLFFNVNFRLRAVKIEMLCAFYAGFAISINEN